MKKYIPYLLLLFVTLACTNPDNVSNQPNDDNTDGNDGNTSFVAEIEGVDLNADSVSARELTSSDPGFIEIMATNTATRQVLTLRVPLLLEEGMYTFGSEVSEGNVLGIYKPDMNSPELFVSESGILTITRYDLGSGVIEGNTVFTLANPTGDGVIEVTFCEFSVAL